MVMGSPGNRLTENLVYSEMANKAKNLASDMKSQAGQFLFGFLALLDRSRRNVLSFRQVQQSCYRNEISGWLVCHLYV